MQGNRAIIFGAGSIGREFASLLTAFGIEVCGVGRSARVNDGEFPVVYGIDDYAEGLKQADWVIAVMPGTPETVDFFDRSFFAAMKSDAVFINVGRGSAVVEADLIEALSTAEIAGAILDVCATEPLPADDPLWSAPNLFLSPHMSGDYDGFERDLVKLFLDNLERYASGQALRNVVDKSAGFISHAPDAAGRS